MFRSGNYQSGELLCKDARIDIEFKDKFKELNLILKDLQNKDVERAMQWA